MALPPVKNISTKITMRNLVKIPQVILEEHSIGKGNKVSVTYGKNYTLMIVMPEGLKLGDRTLERINILVNEPLA